MSVIIFFTQAHTPPHICGAFTVLSLETDPLTHLVRVFFQPLPYLPIPFKHMHPSGPAPNLSTLPADGFQVPSPFQILIITLLVMNLSIN